ncbi:DNA mismatch repair protein MSH3 [Lineolata rhizophorae]|uniref:MutS protein homolog 3 n=1 Tax=Lineolata rhizophorae TaxID=578093 RepID=A0A6A6NY32_9PEZI|nr:DNA mismatch repair protein MSH3 [Lineolata rhizophorae]
MDSGSKSSLPSCSQPRKQQTISSFFAPKSSPPQPSSPAHPLKPSAPASAPNKSNAPRLPASDDGEYYEEPVEQPKLTQRRKRVLHEDESDVESGLPGSKKNRSVSGEVFTAPNGDAPAQIGCKTLEDHRQSSARPGTDGKTPRASDKTSRYLFSSSPVQEDAMEDDDSPEARRRKECLHEKFVKKLGRPDSIAEIKRRNPWATDGVDVNDEAEQGEEEEEEESQPKTLPKKGTARKSKLTPMIKQVIDIKRKHKDTILVVEVGYKFRFFGEDARVAAKELGIVCIPGKLRFDEHPSEAHLDRFASASIPVHRLHVHVKRLVQANHKVGVVRQLETAALKAAGDNRNAPFERKLTNLYTKGTYVDDLDGLVGPVAGPNRGTPATGYLLCITETSAKGLGNDEKVHVGIIAVQPATGDIIYDDFEDGFMRSEIETRLLHIAPCEFVIVGELSRATEKLIKHLSSSKTNVFGDAARVERVTKGKTTGSESYSHISNFYAEKVKASPGACQEGLPSQILDKVHQLSELVTVCLSAMITHMTDYGLEHVFDLTQNFQPFSARSHMLLNGNTLTSLEIYQNQTDHSEKGSLFWALNRTRTRFGVRLLRKWVGRPLLNRPLLEQRIVAVDEIKDGERTRPVDKAKWVLGVVKSDLEKVLTRIYYRKCGRTELLGFLQTLQRVGNEYAEATSPEKAEFNSETLRDAICSLPKISRFTTEYLERINFQAANTDDKYSFFREEHESEGITEHKVGIAAVEMELDAHRKVAAEKLKKKRVEYVTVAGIEYLIEVPNNNLKDVPASWIKQSGTKKVSRFHTPGVSAMIRKRDQHKEALAAACDSAFIALLGEISSNYEAFRDCIQALATIDCLLSLAEVANQPGYVRPIFVDTPNIHIEGGRHPMVEQLLLDPYVPNDTELDPNGTRALLITGPNMGGKSSYVRQIALISIMAQIGSYVPADAARLGLLDAVFTRMGAADNIFAGESTFMVELSETSDILKAASPRSLVILDELGRGTSTHDGVAIAEAVLAHVIRETKCLALFITHYQNLAKLADTLIEQTGENAGSEVRRPLKNVHMQFTENEESGKEITFLYEVGEGVAHRSYGLNVARLANVPESVLRVAAVKSREMEQSMARKKLSGLSKSMELLLSSRAMDGDELDRALANMEQL